MDPEKEEGWTGFISPDSKEKRFLSSPVLSKEQWNKGSTMVVVGRGISRFY